MIILLRLFDIETKNEMGKTYFYMQNLYLWTHDYLI